MRNAIKRPSQVVNGFSSSFCSQSLALSLSEKGEPQSNRLRGHHVDLDGVILRKEFAKMCIGVVRGVSTNLVPLHEGYECGIKFEVVSFDRWFHNRWRDTQRL